MDREQILDVAFKKACGNGYILKDGRKILFIFTHDFAKALWGKKYIGRPVTIQYGTKKNPREAHFFEDCVTWQYHLQQMVIAEDPIKYLGEHI